MIHSLCLCGTFILPVLEVSEILSHGTRGSGLCVQVARSPQHFLTFCQQNLPSS